LSISICTRNYMFNRIYACHNIFICHHSPHNVCTCQIAIWSQWIAKNSAYGKQQPLSKIQMPSHPPFSLWMNIWLCHLRPTFVFLHLLHPRVYFRPYSLLYRFSKQFTNF
jgi:hypothetical protein